MGYFDLTAMILDTHLDTKIAYIMYHCDVETDLNRASLFSTFQCDSFYREKFLRLVEIAPEWIKDDSHQ